jgi:hypothetical protein
MVAITVVVASVLYVWIANLTSDSGKEVVEPIDVKAELYYNRPFEELRLEIIIGENIDWNNYKVMVNNTEVKTSTNTISKSGDIIYFDYQGEMLQIGSFYTVDIIDLRVNTVVFSKSIIAGESLSDITGIFGTVRTHTGEGLGYAEVLIYEDGQLINSTEVDRNGNYQLELEEGSYELICAIRERYIDSLDVLYMNYSTNITIEKYKNIRHDISMEPLIPETVTVKGIVYDNSTSSKISGAEVRLTDFISMQKIVTTGSDGYFEFKVRHGNFSIICIKDGYQEFMIDISLLENTVVPIDISLDLVPPQTGVIKGYIFDSKSSDPLFNITVYTVSPYLTNTTISDENGYFQINVVPGQIEISVNAVGYFHWEDDITVLETEDYFINIYLDKEPGGG